jgi:hypothetical protein
MPNPVDLQALFEKSIAAEDAHQSSLGQLFNQSTAARGQQLQNERYAGQTPNELIKSNLMGAQANQQMSPENLGAYGLNDYWSNMAGAGKAKNETMMAPEELSRLVMENRAKIEEQMLPITLNITDQAMSFYQSMPQQQADNMVLEMLKQNSKADPRFGQLYQQAQQKVSSGQSLLPEVTKLNEMANSGLANRPDLMKDIAKIDRHGLWDTKVAGITAQSRDIGKEPNPLHILGNQILALQEQMRNTPRSSPEYKQMYDQMNNMLATYDRLAKINYGQTTSFTPEGMEVRKNIPGGGQPANAGGNKVLKFNPATGRAE